MLCQQKQSLIDKQTDRETDREAMEEAVPIWCLVMLMLQKLNVALQIEDRERNLTKLILARVCTLNVCGYSTLLRSVQ